MSTFEFVFPAIRGVQAGREYYVSMCPLRHIPQIFIFDEEELKPELRAQRILNKQRIPEIARYLTNNPKEYTFSSLTASVDGDIFFEPYGNENETERNVGKIRIPMNSRIIINDGQHRRAAIEQALKESPELADETVSVVLFMDVGLKRCQQMFADLNRYPVRPTTSLGLLYDHRDEAAQLSKGVMFNVPIFSDLTETERSNISNRSIKLFTLSGIHNASRTLLADLSFETFGDKLNQAVEFWIEVSKQIPDWQLAKDRKVNASELRQEYIHSHALALAAIARAGNCLLKEHRRNWKTKLKKLSTLDWSRSNTKLWEGRAMNAGRLSKRNTNVTLSGNLVKKHLGLKFSVEEDQLEKEFRRSRNGQSSK